MSWSFFSRAALLLIAAVVVCDAYQFPLKTNGRYVVDSVGKRVKFAGVNWYGLDSYDWAVGGLHVNKLDNIADLIVQWGFTAVRLPWSLQLWEQNPVALSKALVANPDLNGLRGLQIMDKVVYALAKRNILIMLDNHVSRADWCCSNTDGNGLWFSQAYPAGSFHDDWRGIVARYKNVSQVVAVDVRNEPRCDGGNCANWGQGGWYDMAAMGEWIGNAIHEINPNLLIVVEGINYALDLTGVEHRRVNLSIPNKVVYSAHDYSWDFSFSSCQVFNNILTENWAYILTSVQSPVFLGEFGVDSHNSESAQWLTCLLDFLKETDIDFFYWSLDGTQSSGSGRTFGAVESFGLTDVTWTKSGQPELLARLQAIQKPTKA